MCASGMDVYLAPGPGFEPGLEDSKSSVLPLNDPGTRLFRISDYSFLGLMFGEFVVGYFWVRVYLRVLLD